MSIEIRQLVVRCQVVITPAPPAQAAARALAAESREIKEQLLAQCRAWLRDELRRLKDR